MAVMRWLLAITGSVYFRAFSVAMVGLCWVVQYKKIEAGYAPEWDWIIFLSLGTIWELQEWYKLSARKKQDE